MGYSAPLDKLPLFVRSGAIIPMYQQMMYDWERPADTLTLEIFPNGKSSYELYEDDGLTREHRKGVFATTKFEVNATNKTIDVTLNKAEGDFKGSLKNRIYLLNIRIKQSPKSLESAGKRIKKYKTLAEFEKADNGWFFDTSMRKGTIRVKTEKVSTDISKSLKVIL